MGPIPLYDTSLVSKGPPLEPNGTVRKYKLSTGAAKSLLSLALAGEYIFFTPAVLYIYGRFTDVPLIDFMGELGKNVPLFYYKADKPIFVGLDLQGIPDWNHVLWAVRPEYWLPLLDFLCSLTMAIRTEKTILRYGQQTLEILDPLALDVSPRRLILQDGLVALTTLPISAFGVYGNRFKLAFEVSAPQLPILKQFAVDSRMIAYADAYFAEKNPLDAADDFDKWSKRNEHSA